MAGLEYPEEREAPEADAAEQSMPVDEQDDETRLEELARLERLPLEADPADAVEQAVPVPVDEDDYR